MTKKDSINQLINQSVLFQATRRIEKKEHTYKTATTDKNNKNKLMGAQAFTRIDIF